jgi:hypothetical protein
MSKTIGSDDDAPEVYCSTEDEFSTAVIRSLMEMMAEHEKKAADTGDMVEFVFELAQEAPSAPGDAHSIVRMKFVCEPGKPSRQIGSAIVASPLDRDGNSIQF